MVSQLEGFQRGGCRQFGLAQGGYADAARDRYRPLSRW
jgi:hypothetical protein